MAPARSRVRAALGAAGFIALALLWEWGARRSSTGLIPGPSKVLAAVGELAASGKLARFVVASLYRVTWGYLLAVAVGIPLGVLMGWSPRFQRATDPIFQLFRPISPLAWIPIAILWLGVGDRSAVFIIFVACVGPLTVASLNAVRRVPGVHVEAARNFGLSPARVVARVVLPSALPQIAVAVRQTLFVAWSVVVMAEMMAVNSGLGFLIIDSRNAGDRYDLVIAGMALIGLIGLALEKTLQQLERIPSLRWGLPRAQRADGTLPEL